MNKIIYRVTLDMFDTHSQKTIKAKKGDSACEIHISFTENGKLYRLGEDYYAYFSAKKADGTFVYDNCTIQGDTIIYDFSSSIKEGACQITAFEGVVECEVTLYKGDKQLTSPRFTLVVDGTVYNGEDIISTPESDVLRKLINDANTLIDDVEKKLNNGDFVGEKGGKGDKGDKGDAFTYEDFTEEQLTNLRKSVYPIIEYEKSVNVFNPEDAVSGFINQTNGKVGSHATYWCSGYVPIIEGKYYFTNGILNRAAIYDTNKAYVSAVTYGSKSGWAYVVAPINGYIRFTIANEGNVSTAMLLELNNIDEISNYPIDTFIPYANEMHPKGYLELNEQMSELLDKYTMINSQIEKVSKETSNRCSEIEGQVVEVSQKGTQRISELMGSDSKEVSLESLTANEVIPISDFPRYIKKGISWSFRGKFDSFSKLFIGNGYNSPLGDWLEITSTQLIWHHVKSTGAEEIEATKDLGLTISSFIQVVINLDDDSKCTVTINTLSGSVAFNFLSTVDKFDFDFNGSPFVLSESVMNNVKFNVISKDFKNAIWLFGDSYSGLADNRISGQLRKLGYTNKMLIHSRPGQNSAEAYTDLENALKYNTPKILIWCLGMNDSSRSEYATTFEKVKSICETKNIMLVPMKIPTVSGRNKEQINSFIEDSGLKYVDAYSAVGTNSAAEWYEGYLDTDNIHPSVLGARAIAMQMLVDVPEILQFFDETEV